MEKSLEFDGVSLTVRELTVGEVRDFIRSIDLSAPDLVDEALLEGCSLALLRLMTGLDDAGMDALRPSQVRLLLEAGKEVNADFFAMIARVSRAVSSSSTSSSPG
ncbi:MAG: hypothetical protein HQL56_09805 [Magnetococcales bacterium]|nr:hypothetical protein [Magnetococcales bacterium]